MATPIFELLEHHDYGNLHLARDPATGLRAIVAIHDTRLGPALGGCRFIHYETDEDATVDALRLARGMTYKAALAGIPHGGGKSVLIKPKAPFDRKALFKAFGRFIESLGGSYITAADSGTGIADMEVLRLETRHVTGVEPAHGGSGDPSPFTALGVRRGIEACVRRELGRSDLAGIKVAVQGVGQVGFHLCRQLHALGAELTVADVDDEKCERARQELGAHVTSLDAIFETECEVFAPCALGSALNDESIPRLRCKIVAGAANNQLAEPRHGDALLQRGILYAPDYAINAGGLINVAQEYAGYDESLATDRAMNIYDTIYEIADRAAQAAAPTYQIADALVKARLAKVGA